jgi:hypothetical protein
MDEAPVQVLKEPDKKTESKSYMWVRKTGDLNKKGKRLSKGTYRQTLSSINLHSTAAGLLL